MEESYCLKSKWMFCFSLKDSVDQYSCNVMWDNITLAWVTGRMLRLVTTRIGSERNTVVLDVPCLTSLKVALADNKLIQQPSTRYQFPQQTLHSVRSMKINCLSELALWNTNPRSRLCKYIRCDENQTRCNYEWYPQCVNIGILRKVPYPYILSFYGHFHRTGGSICFATMAHYFIFYFLRDLIKNLKANTKV